MDKARMEKSKPRSSKACDRCRLKKVKCDGSYPCARCTKDDNACVFGNRGKGRDMTVTANQVEQLTAQTEILKLALRTIWTKYVKPTVPAGTASPSVHEMCRQVGVLDDTDSRQHHQSSDELFQHSSGETSPTMDEGGEISEEEDLPEVLPLIFGDSRAASVSYDIPGSGVYGSNWNYDPVLSAAGQPNLDIMQMQGFAADASNHFSAGYTSNGPYLHGPTLLSQREPLSMHGFERQQQRNGSNIY